MGASEVIDVRVRFTLDPSSAPLDFSSYPLTGFDAQDLPTQGYYFDEGTNSDVFTNFATIDRAVLNTHFVCEDTFTNGCNGPEPRSYSYSFFLISEPGKPSINFVDSLSLAPGESYEYVFAQFMPTNGAASPGTYRFYRSGLDLHFEGRDDFGTYLRTESVTLGLTCPTGPTDDCAFTRIVPVPEPETYGMMLAGLGLVGLWARKRLRSTAR